MKKHILFFTIILFSISSVFANGDVTGDKAIVLQVDGGAKTLYNVYTNWSYGACGSYNTSTAATLSDLGNLHSLVLNGIYVTGWTDNTDWVAGQVEWKIWLTSDAEPGSMTGSFNVGGYGSACSIQDVACSSGNNRFVGMDNQSVDLINGLAPGEYYFKVYPHGQMRYNCGSFNQDDNSAVTVTFTIDPKVTFNNNGGSGTMSDQYVTYNTATQLSTNTFTRAGYIYNGWNTSADGSGISYSDEQNVTLTENTTLYAQWSAYTTAQNGDWNTAATWTANVVPPADAATQINHAVTINGTVANNPATIEITTGNSITFGASGDITVNTSITNDGTIDMTSGGLLTFANNATFTNNSTFTAGTGDVVFSGVGTVSGATTFNNIEVQGAVDFGGSSSIDGILTINGGYLNSNSITYNENSTLKYAANYDINSGDKSWYSNVASSGSAQEGIPWNVEIPTGILVQLNDSYPFSINGSILIDGSFRLGTDGTTHWGNFLLRGNFTNNGTFTPNNREVLFNGTSPQTLTGSTTFDYFQMNGSGGLTLNDAITVNKTLTFTNGTITLGDNNITVDATAGAISGGSSSSYAITNGIGYLIQDVGSSEKTFPVGTSTSYAPAFLTQAGTQENLSVRVKEGIDNATNDDDFTVNLQWTIDEETAGSNDITTKFQWNSTNENTFFDNQGQVKIGRYISGSYSSSVATVAGSDPYTASASAMADDISAEIPFIIGNTMAFTASGYRTAQNGNWNTGSTWVGGVVPPANAVCMILHHVTVNSTLNDADEVDIYENKSVTFQASGDLTVNGVLTNHGMLKTDDATASLTINGTLKNTSTASVNMTGSGTLNFTDGSVFTNEGSFTAGTGTVVFAGAGTATGSLVFNNLNISGSVDLGASASLNNILKVSGGGDLINNSITYSTGSTLKFDQDYSLGDNKIWYRNVDASGNSQEGIPWNVEISATRTVNISDGFFRAINGNLIITGQFDLSASAGGDLKIKGDFENNGTFTHNSRFVMFYGNGNQKIKGSNSTSFYDLTIDNLSNINLEKETTISNNLNFTNGKIIIDGFNLTVSGSINSPSSTKYVVTNGIGYLIQNVGTSETTFPIGTMTNYNPAYLTETTAEIYNVRVKNSIDNTVNDPTQVVNVQWTIDNGGVNADNVTIKLQWNASDEASGFTAGTDDIAYYSGGYNNANATTSGLTASRTVASSVANSPTPFIVAEATAFTGGIYTIASGDWNNAATWNGGVIPATGNCAIIKNTHTVTLTSDPTVKSISIENGGTLNCSTHTITLDNGGAIANSGTFTAGTGKVVFSGTGSISSGSVVFNNVDLNGAVSFGSSTTINGILSINAGGSVNTNAPVYGATSTLKYNQGGNISRSSEWQYNIAETDPGYPANVQISNSTILDVDADNNDDNYYNTRFLKGNLTIDALSEISLGDMGGGVNEDQICGVYAKGDIINNGTITLSSSFGGDMMLEGDIINSGTFNWNSRAIFFTGDNNTDQNITGLTEIPFILMTRGANVILQNNLTVNGSGTEFITFARPSSTNTGSIDLNGNTLTCSGSGNIELNDISGAEVTSSVAGGRIEVSGGNATFSGIGSGTLNFGTTSSTDVTLAIDGGTMTFPSTLGIVTVYGTLEIGDGATISNIPTYSDNSTLHYKRAGTFTMGVEWGKGSDVADNIPKNVTVSQGSSAAVLNMNANRHALGTLLIEANATLEVAQGIGQLTVNNLTVDANGTIVLKSPSDNGVAGSLITTGTVTNNGTMQAERYIFGGKYTYVSPPNAVTNSQMFTNNSNGHFNPNFYTYNQAFEAPIDPATGTYAEWETEVNGFKNAWVEAHDGEGGSGIILSPAVGYAYYNDVNKMFVFDGTFNTGDKNITLTYDNNDGNGGYFDGWNLIANPYPSALNWDDANWDKTYVDAAIYYWDGTTSNEGNYKYYVSSGNYDDGTDVVNGGSQMIPASQAFFVKAKASAGSGGQTLSIPNAARVHSTQSYWNKNSSKSAQSQFIRLQATANNVTDELVARYIPEGTVDYDGDFDAYKMYSYSTNIPQIYSYNSVDGAGYAINSLPINSMNEALPIGIEIQKQGLSECKIELTDYKTENKHVYLEDIEMSNFQNLITNPVYNFNIADSSDVRERFFIHYEENTAPSIENNISNYSVNFEQNIDYTIPENIFIDNDLGDELNYTASLASGESLPEWLSFNTNSLHFSGFAPKAAQYTIRLTATDIMGASVSEDFELTINAILPSINTNEIVEIQPESAKISGELISSGGENIENVGICWSTEENPTLEDDYSIEILNNNLFTGIADNLQSNTTYYVRSYATNSVGVQYGNQLNFTTLLTETDNIKKDLISVYPNPTSGILFLNNPQKQQLEIKITDVLGKILVSEKVNHTEFSFNLKAYYHGIYFVEIKTSDKTIIKKIIKE